MKIAVFHELYPGGARRAVLEFGKELSRNHKVDLYYVESNKEKGLDEIFSEIFFYKFTPKKWKGKDWKAKLYKDTFEIYKLYSLHKKIASEIDNKNYDFVFVHGSQYTQAPFVLRFLKTKSVYYCQEPLRMVYESLFDIPQSLGIIKKTYERINRNNRRIIDRSNVHYANVLFANSKFTKNNIKKAYGLDSTVSYMGIDPKRFFLEESKKEYDLLFVGSRDDIDGYSLLNEAIGLMKTKPKIRWLLREEEWISDDREMRKIYSSSKILVCLAYKEPFGLMPIEAQACGTVVVAVKEGGYIDTVKDGVSGIFVKRNSEDIAKTLSALLKSNKKINELSTKALGDVNANWTWEINTKKLLHNINSNAI